jgi:hypothetical protein
MSSIWDDLAEYRKSLSLPPTGSESDKSSIAKLEIDGQSFLVSTPATIPTLAR